MIQSWRGGMFLAAVVLAASHVSPAPAGAGTQDGAVVALHVGPHSMKGDTPCDYADGEAPFSCRDFRSSWPIGESCNVYVVVARGNPEAGIGEVVFGIRYNNGEAGENTPTDRLGVDIFNFTDCASGLSPCEGPCPPCCPWEAASGSANRITWNTDSDCQTEVIGEDGVHTLAGTFYIYAYSEDLFEITPHYDSISKPNEFAVRDCNDQVTDLPYPEAAGAVAFGSGTGYNPCDAVPVAPTTWSRLKTRYGESKGGAP